MPAQPTNSTSLDDSQSLDDWLLARQNNIAAKVSATPVAAGDKSQIPSTKFQINPNSQVSNPKTGALPQKPVIPPSVVPAQEGIRENPRPLTPERSDGGQALEIHVDKVSQVEKVKEEKPAELRLEGFDPKDKNLLEEKNIPGIQNKDIDSGFRRNDNGSISGNPSVAKAQPAATSPTDNQSQKAAEELTRADIFKLLGMAKIEEVEKKKNLDEMEETIWADFVENDLPAMLSGEQKEKYLDLLKTAPAAEKIINFFGKNLPVNFEEKYLAKTLQFKAEIVREQIDTLLAAASGKDPQKEKLLGVAKDAIAAGEWKKAEELMAGYQ